MNLQRRASSLLLLAVFIGAVLSAIALLHGAGPARDGERLSWAVEAVEADDATTRYRGRFARPERGVATALYLESLSGATKVSLNGTVLQRWRDGRDAPALGDSQPLLLPLPAALLRADGNELVVEQQGTRSTGTFVGASYLGEEALLSRDFAQRHLLKHTLPIVIIAATVALGGLSLALWLRRRQERVYAWHVLVCLTGSAYCALPLAQPPLPGLWLDALLLLLFLWFVVAAAWLGLCLAAAPQARTWRRTTVAVLAGSATILLASWLCSPQQFRQALPWAYMAIIALGGYTTCTVFWRQYLRRWDALSFWVLGAVMCICMVALHDGALLLGRIEPEDGFWLAYGAPPAVIVFSAILLRHFSNALAESERLNRELEQRVAAREAQLAANYAALQRAESERLVASERERLFGDLHDGLGGTLIATLSRLSNEGAGDSPAAQGVQTALDDLRLALDSLAPEQRSLRAALAPLRERLANACADAGMAMRFDLGALAEGFELPRPQTLQLLRIVQEASTNAVRHAKATELRIVIRECIDADGGAVLEIGVEDDGCGMPADAERPGRYGLAGLRRRAAQLGGAIEWQPRHPGTRVQLRFALQGSRRTHQFM